MKSSIFWDITPCTALLLPAPAWQWFLAWLNLRPWRWRRHVPRKRWLTFNGLHGVISQKTELYIRKITSDAGQRMCGTIGFAINAHQRQWPLQNNKESNSKTCTTVSYVMALYGATSAFQTWIQIRTAWSQLLVSRHADIRQKAKQEVTWKSYIPFIEPPRHFNLAGPLYSKPKEFNKFRTDY
jgi:hypothetical protein